MAVKIKTLHNSWNYFGAVGNLAWAVDTQKLKSRETFKDTVYTVTAVPARGTYWYEYTHEHTIYTRVHDIHEYNEYALH